MNCYVIPGFPLGRYYICTFTVYDNFDGKSHSPSFHLSVEGNLVFSWRSPWQEDVSRSGAYSDLIAFVSDGEADICFYSIATDYRIIASLELIQIDLASYDSVSTGNNTILVNYDRVISSSSSKPQVIDLTSLKQSSSERKPSLKIALPPVRKFEVVDFAKPSEQQLKAVAPEGKEERKHYRGVRQRLWAKFATEIRDPNRRGSRFPVSGFLWNGLMGFKTLVNMHEKYYVGNVKLEEEDSVILLLSSLPKSYETLKTTLLIGNVTLPVDDVMSALMDSSRVNCTSSSTQGKCVVVRSENKNGHQRGSGRSRSRNSGHGNDKSKSHGKQEKSSIECWYCEEIGHIARKCPERKDKKNGKKHVNNTNVAAEDNKSSYGDLYFLFLVEQQEGNTIIGGASVSTHAGSSNDDFELWHKQQRHLSKGGMLELYKRKLLQGVKSCRLDFYKFCVFGKQKRLSFKAASHTSKGVPKPRGTLNVQHLMEVFNPVFIGYYGVLV
ncbi:hypothetical protein RJ640_006988 [Escallonia rubra]|uniref:CCHC-type domain-containing protein n=1 Tax=Escallonia rubra TaxID=112253 RepID=A0AA88UN31_9ASTE|nr:hypothetical protein RJ640_006988 [Escallonia rubra]